MIKYVGPHIPNPLEGSAFFGVFEPEFVECTVEEFIEWLLEQKQFQLDVETDMTNSIIDKRLVTMQFGSFLQKEKVQYVIHFDSLSQAEKRIIYHVLESETVIKHIHNAAFEVQIFRNLNVFMERVSDTMLREKALYMGNDAILDEEGSKFFSLESVARRRLEIELDKTYQTRFGEPELTSGHIVYAAQDVDVLDLIWEIQERELRSSKFYPPVEGVRFTYMNDIPTLENEAVLPLAEMMHNGFNFDEKKWIVNASEAAPIVETYLNRLNTYLETDEVLRKRAIELGYINTERKIEINWNSPKQKLDILTYAFPDLIGTTKPIIKKYLKDNPDIRNSVGGQLLHCCIEGDYEPLLARLLEHCESDMITKGYVIPANTIRINWGAWQQTLPLLQAIKPSLTTTDEEAMNKLNHPIAFCLLDYRGAKMLTSTFGLKFLEKVDSDGKVRTRFNQILETGRLSSADPNMQQIPTIDDDDPMVANKYRMCFIPDSPDWVIVGSDYKSQELVIIAAISKDPVWLEALSKGWDLHSVCADLVFGKEWLKGAKDDCKYMKIKDKCKCPAHKRMRNSIKPINFG